MDEKKRSRKKQLFHDILKQVEFYFSSANLSKDRFMTQVLADNENGIELTLLLTFNKLKSLTTDINVLKKALNLSDLLILTENETRVKSKIPFIPKKNVDECTIYVERLPLDSNQDFLRQIFVSFGAIDYVSLPKFQNGKIKGFAFVEFSDPSGAEKAVEEFKKSGSYLPIDMAPGNLRSICTFDKKTKERLLKSKTKNFECIEQNSSREDEDMAVVTEEIESFEIEPVKDDPSFDSEDDNDKKRKHKTSPSTLERKKKKVKPDEKEEIDDITQSDNNSSLDVSSEQPSLDKTVKDAAEKEPDNHSSQINDDKKDEHNQDNVEMSDEHYEAADDEMNPKLKKKRRQKNKPKKERPAANSGLLILTKADWKKLRNKYLTIQWEKMKSLKKHFHKRPHFHNYDNFNSIADHDDIDVSVEFPNSVVKITLSEPVIDIKEFKMLVKSKSDQVMNIDVKEGCSEVHVRFSDAEAAHNFIPGDDAPWKCNIISGDEESRYWTKIRYDRQSKWEKKNRKIDAMEEEDARHVMALDDASRDDKNPISKGLKEKPTLSIIPGTIVKIEMPEPIVNVKQFKTDLKNTCKDIHYVDLKEGDSEAYIRLGSAENALSFISLGTFKVSQLLTGEEEQAYWDKINDDRTNKFNKTVRINKRGKQKIIKKAENLMGKHIIIEDSDG